MRAGYRVALLIAGELYERTREAQTDSLKRVEVIKIAKRIAGWDSRTIRKYIEGLTELGFIKQINWETLYVDREAINKAINEENYI